MSSPHLRALGRFALLLCCGSIASGQNEDVSRLPTWEDEIAKGCVPYHQLTVDDFRIDDQANPEGVYFVSPFIHPHWHYLTTGKGGFWYAYVDRWVVYSGFDKNASSRKSKFRDMKGALPHVQAYLDIYEICGRQLATLKPGELPSARGATPAEAIEILTKSMDAFLKEKYKAVDAEAQEFQKVTGHGANMKKVRELAKAIRKRLDALPAQTAPAPDSAATTTPTPSPTPAK
jgi:hypothetical protein